MNNDKAREAFESLRIKLAGTYHGNLLDGVLASIGAEVDELRLWKKEAEAKLIELAEAVVVVSDERDELKALCATYESTLALLVNPPEGTEIILDELIVDIATVAARQESALKRKHYQECVEICYARRDSRGYTKETVWSPEDNMSARLAAESEACGKSIMDSLEK
jgi:hypothetical protein